MLFKPVIVQLKHKVRKEVNYNKRATPFIYRGFKKKNLFPILFLNIQFLLLRYTRMCNGLATVNCCCTTYTCNIHELLRKSWCSGFSQSDFSFTVWTDIWIYPYLQHLTVFEGFKSNYSLQSSCSFFATVPLTHGLYCLVQHELKTYIINLYYK